MKKTVIYARYSSYGQNEMSIEGQINECRRCAEEHNYIVLQEYIDRAQSATTDKRPEFLRMISDSENGGFDVVLVYQFDRFARNMNDSGYYKEMLANNKHRGHRPAVEDYLLTGKLYCGYCKIKMNGISGKSSHSDIVYRYYTCGNAPRKCKKKNVREAQS